MAEEATVRMKCPSCGTLGRRKASYLYRDIRCPKCGNTVRFAPVSSHEDAGSGQAQAQLAGAPPKDAGTTQASKVPHAVPMAENAARVFDTGSTIGASVAGGGLFVLALSPLFKWIEFGAGGVTGIAGDGKIILGVSVLAIGAYAVAVATRKWLTPILLAVQAWGTLAVFWMGGLIWKVSSIPSSADVQGNPFAALFATQISPGAGLHLGLIGGIAVAGALGFLVVRRLLSVGSLKPYYVTQGLGCVFGVLLALFAGPNGHWRPQCGESASPALDAASVSPQAGDVVRPGREASVDPDRSARERTDYIKLVHLYDLKARYYTSVLDERVPGVEFKLRNTGQRTLSKVKVTVYFRDAGGNVIAEKDYHPVFLSEFSMGPSKPLKPGYVWQIERGKFYQAKDVPTEWQEGNVDARVTEVDFATPKEVKVEGLDSPEKQAYLAHLDLYEFQSRYYTTVLDERVPGVEFKLKNRGNRTLKFVEVTVFFKDGSGRVISEEDYHPVLVSDSSFTPGKPLKPGYIWHMERGKFYQAPLVPDEWQEGSAEAKITALEFAD